MSLGFIDYVFDYFRGPAGADGAPGPEGPPGPGHIFKSTSTSFFETAGETVEAGEYSCSFTIPSGALLVSVQADTIGADGVTPYTLPTGSYVKVFQADNTHFTATLVLNGDVVSGPNDPLANCTVLYYLAP